MTTQINDTDQISKTTKFDLSDYFNYDPFDTSTFSKLFPGKEVDFYLWATHGTNISSVQNFYPIETKFEALVFYSKPFENIDDSDLITIFTKDPCKMLTGTCPIIPIENKYKKYAYLPPLIFGLSPSDNEPFKIMMGLYYFRLKKINEEECVIVKKEKVLKYENIYELYNYDSFTYSSIFKNVLEHAKNIGIAPESIMLGIYSCQGIASKYKEDYKYDITNLVPKRVNISIPEAEIIPNASFTMQNISSNTNNIYIIPTTFIPLNNPNTDSWKGALAGIHSQGCALNIFNFYGVIDTPSARELAVCLTSKGTSIFRIVDIINNIFIKSNIKNTYIIIRCKLEHGCNVLFDFTHYMRSIGAFSNNVLVFKLYKEALHNGKYSQIGHAVSIYGKGNLLYFIDPQNSIIHNISDLDAIGILSFIQNLYGIDSFHFMDIIFFTNKIPPATNTKYYTLYEILDTPPDIYIIQRTEDVTFGGKKNKKSNKSKKMKMHKNKHMKTKNNKNKYKTHKNSRKQRGGTDDDPYIEMVKNTDKKNKVKSVLLLENPIIQ